MKKPLCLKLFRGIRAQQKTGANLTENKPFFGEFQVSESDWPPAGAPGGTGQPSNLTHVEGEGKSKKRQRAKKLNRP